VISDRSMVFKNNLLINARNISYLGMWGLTKDGTFICEASASSMGIMERLKTKLGQGATVDVYHTVMSDLKKVRFTLSEEISRFQAIDTNGINGMNDADRSRRMLYLFQKDLLPGINAMILESKGKRDFVSEKNKVEPFQHIGAWIFIVTLNATLLFYIYLFALRQTSARQEAWFQTFVIWLIFEVFVMSTMVVYISHFLVPSIIMRDLQVVQNRLLKTIRDYRLSLRSRDDNDNASISESKNDFNVADYFFVSKRLSVLYPNLMESKIIQKFKSPWPHQSYLRTRSISKSYSKRFSTLVRSGSMIVVFILKGLLSMPPGVQDMIISLVTMVTTGNLFTWLIQMYRINPILPFIPIAVFLLFIHFVIRMILRRKNDNAENFLKIPFTAPNDDRVVGGTLQERILKKPLNSSIISNDTALRSVLGYESNVNAGRIKSRRRSVLEGINVSVELHMNQKQHEKKILPTIKFEDISSDSSSDSNVRVAQAEHTHCSVSILDNIKSQSSVPASFNMKSNLLHVNIDMSDESESDGGPDVHLESQSNDIKSEHYFPVSLIANANLCSTYDDISNESDAYVRPETYLNHDLFDKISEYSDSDSVNGDMTLFHTDISIGPNIHYDHSNEIKSDFNTTTSINKNSNLFQTYDDISDASIGSDIIFDQIHELSAELGIHSSFNSNVNELHTLSYISDETDTVISDINLDLSIVNINNNNINNNNTNENEFINNIQTIILTNVSDDSD
jgi:hypothetical protein